MFKQENGGEMNEPESDLPGLTSLPTTLGQSDEPDPEPEVDPGQSSGVPPEIEAWRREREDYQQQLERQQAMINQLLQGVRPAGSDMPQQHAAPAASAGLDALPDPVESPDKFREALNNYVRSQVQSATSDFERRQTTQQTRQQQIAAIQNRFWEQNADLRGYDEFVSAAYNREAARLQGLGMNPEDVVLRDPETVTKRVAQMARERMAELGIRKNSAPSGNRTAGLSGGTRGVPPSTRAAKEVQSDLVGEIEKYQTSTLAEFYGKGA
ncbi:MAG: hypothetical protein EA405_13615 [Rhodospirillales bacterium]|nr:MAG: hypothetical protein EA405_13615 [Rhodospirillales bacterium]